MSGEYLEYLLNSGVEDISSEVQPNWLLTDFESPIWIIKSSGPLARKSQKNQDLHIKWGAVLPGGSLLSLGYSKVLKHIKLLCIAHLECPVSCCSKAEDIQSVQSALLNIAEFMSFQYPGELEKYGLASFGSERIDEYLRIYSKFGAIGTSFLRERWDNYFKSLYSERSVVSDVYKWGKSNLSTEFSKLNPVERECKDLNGKIKVVISDGNDIDFLEFSKLWLLREGCYDEKGCINNRVFFSIAAPGKKMRNSQLHHIKEHLKQYELCKDYRHLNFAGLSNREKLGHKNRSHREKCDEGISSHTLINRIRRMEGFSAYCEYIPELKDSLLNVAKIDRPEKYQSICRPGGRTRTIPEETAMYIYNKLIHWVMSYSEDIFEYAENLMKDVYSIQKNIVQYGLLSKSFKSRATKLPNDGWAVSFDRVSIPESLKDLNVLSVYSIDNDLNKKSLKSNIGASVVPEKLRSSMNVMDMININSSVIALLMSALCIKRQSEVLSLKRGAVLEGLYPGNISIYSEVAKVQVDGIRGEIERPLPRFLGKIIEKHEAFSENIRSLLKDKNPSVQDKIFIIPCLNGITSLTDSVYYRYLDLFCDYIEVPVDEVGKRWYIRPHECRRFLALSFFWMSGRGNSLSALAWWMGHTDIKSTWRYIRDELSGQEVSEAEASFACEALKLGQGTGSEKLREIVCAHFLVSDISLIAPSDLKSYLELLHVEGRYKISPIGFDPNDGVGVEMAIVIIENQDG